MTIRELSDMEQREARTLARIESDWSEASAAYRTIQECHRNEKRLWIVAAALALGAVLMAAGWMLVKGTL